MTSAHQLEQRLLAAWPLEHWHSTGVVLAVSGGADSVTLAAAMARLKPAGGGELLAAHFNHGLRGPEADADEQFVAELCSRLKLRLVTGCGDVRRDAQAAGDGIEAAARAARYEFLVETARQHGARYLATAHNADDQAETILHHLLRGTGLAGLAGMPRVRPMGEAVTLIRPLLTLRRREIEDYLQELGLKHREDATNRDLSLTRNRIRHELLPQLAAGYNPAVVEALLRLGQLASESQAVIERLVDELLERHVRMAAERVEIDCEPISAQPRYLIRELLIRIWRERQWPQQAMGLAEWEALAGMIQGGTAVSTLPGAVRARRESEQLVLTRSR